MNYRLCGAWLFSMLLAVPLAVQTAAAVGEAEQDVLERAKQLARENLLKPAVGLLSTELEENEGLTSLEYARAATALADLYYQSGMNAECVLWADRAVDRLEAEAQPPATLAVTRVRAGALAARALAQLGEDDRARAAVARTDRFNQKLPTDAVRELQLAALRVEVDAIIEDTPLAEAWRNLAPQVQQVRLQLHDSTASATSDQRVAGSRAVVRALAAFGRHGEAAQEIQWQLQQLPDDADQQRVQLLSQLASQQTLAGDSLAARGHLREAIDVLRDSRQAQENQDAPAAALEEVDNLLLLADLLRRFAEAAEGGPDPVADALAEATRLTTRATGLMSQIQGADADSLASRRLLASKRRLENARAQALLQKRVGRQPYDDAAQMLQELLVNLRPAVLPADPRLGMAQSALAAEHLAEGDYRRSEGLLAEAIDSAVSRGARGPQLARPLLLMAEVRYAQGRLGEAKALLDDAEQTLGAATATARRGRGEAAMIASNAGSRVIGDATSGDVAIRFGAADQTLSAWAEVLRGRIHVTEGHYTPALDRFVKAEALCKAVGAEADIALAAALVHRGSVHRTLGQFDKALQACNQAVEMRLRHTDAGDPQMLPYYLALGGVAAAKRDTHALADAIHAARAIVGANPAGAPHTLLHLDAMHHYLEHLESPSAELRQQARVLWREALAIQTRQDLTVDRARTLHYLSRLDLDEALESREARGRSYRQQGGEYDQKAQAFQQQLEEHRRAAEALAAREQQFLTQHADYSRLDVTKRGEEYRRLTAVREALLADADQHALAGRKLEEQRARLEEFFPVMDKEDSLVRQLTKAEAAAQQACTLLDQLGVYPGLHYAALCNHAEILRALAGDDARRRAAAIERLEAAVKLVETPRLFVGDEAAQTEFFARHRTAYELLVQWNVTDGNLVGAVAYADISRNRTFLDRLSRTDSRAEGQVESADAGVSEHQQTVARIRELSSQGEAKLSAADQEELRLLKDRLRRLRVRLLSQQQHSQARRRGDSLVGGQLNVDAVQRVVQDVLASGPPTLYYFVGDRHSYLFLLGVQPGEIEAVRLWAPGPRSGDTEVPASRDAIQLVVSQFLEVCRSPARAAALAKGDGAGRLARAARVIIPRDVGRRLAELDAATIAIAPDGPLFQLPFEALVTDAPRGAPTQFLMDVAPPVVTVPSLMVASTLAASSQGGVGAPPRLLSVARPKYATATRLASAPRGTAMARYAALGGSLADLVHSQQESDALCAMAPAGEATQMVGAAATEAALRSALQQTRPTLVHLATHGVATTDDGAAEGLIALAAPGDGDFTNPQDDGFLELGEIAELPLGGCELAVLSACETNLGARRELEIGDSFARAFLAAGARRVAATRWEMDDQSGAAFVEKFFAEAVGSGASVPVAMRRARKALRASPDWNSPYHWGVFALLGPPR